MLVVRLFLKEKASYANISWMKEVFANIPDACLWRDKETVVGSETLRFRARSFPLK